MNAQFQNPIELLVGGQQQALWAQGQVGAQNYRAAQQQANAMNRYGLMGLSNFVGSVWQTPEQRKLERAQDIAAEVRARRPEMQVKRFAPIGDRNGR